MRHSDDKSCIILFENPVFYDYSKYIDIWPHFLMDRVQKGAVFFEYVPSDSQVANIFMKTLAKGKFEMLREKLVLVDKTLLVKRECSILL